MTKEIISTSKYIQGKGELEKLYDHVHTLGNKFFVLIDSYLYDVLGDQVKSSFNNHQAECHLEKFNGECSKVEINRLLEVSKGFDVIIGVGGGKTLDTSKATAHYKECPVVIVPTAASTDAPCSALSVIYTEEGVFEEYLFLPKNPDAVIVDSQVIANAPVRLLVAGIGDALATYFEARATLNSNGNTMAGGKPTKAAMALARLCYDTIVADGLKAKLAVEQKSVTKALENVIEANTYLSGVGFESGGLAAAHAIHNGMTAMKDTHQMYHGEKVSFGTLVQLVLEDASNCELEEVLNLCTSVGLPITLGELGVKEINPEELRQVAEIACAKGDTMGNMPGDVTVDDVVAAILSADAIGCHYLERHISKKSISSISVYSPDYVFAE